MGFRAGFTLAENGRMLRTIMAWKNLNDPEVAAAVEAAGGPTAVGKVLGITKAAVWRWGRVPKKHLRKFARLSGYSVRRLRPDLYKRNGKRRRTK